MVMSKRSGKSEVPWLGEGTVRCLLSLQRHDSLLVMQNQSQKTKPLKLEFESQGRQQVSTDRKGGTPFEGSEVA